MTSKAAATLTTTSRMLQERLQERLAGRGERGASALEYVGMVIVAAILVTAVVGAIKGANVGGKVTEKVNEILKG